LLPQLFRLLDGGRLGPTLLLLPPAELLLVEAPEGVRDSSGALGSVGVSTFPRIGFLRMRSIEQNPGILEIQSIRIKWHSKMALALSTKNEKEVPKNSSKNKLERHFLRPEKKRFFHIRDF
jgi:hypothetical protein